MGTRPRQRRTRPGLALGAVAVLIASLGAGSSQAGVEDLVKDAERRGAGQLERLEERIGGGAEEDGAPARHCPRRLQELGVCKPHVHEPDGDFLPFDGDDSASRRGEQAGKHAREHHRGAAAGGGADHAHGRTLGRTTLEQTIEGEDDPAQGFQTLRLAGGESRIVREELAQAKPGRGARRVSLLYAGQTTDWQLVDEESPARVEFLDTAANAPFPDQVAAAWRPQEFLGAYAVEQAIRQLNQYSDRSPVAQRAGRRAAMDMVLMTGDQADNQHLNETGWVQRLLEGGRLDPNSGTNPSSCPEGQEPSGQTADPELYAGVQDYDDYAEGQQFYDPDEPIPPKYGDWPTYPGIVDRAQEPFDAQGLDVPSYVVFGNHDALAQGNQKAIAPFEQVAVGCVKPMVPVGDVTEVADVLDPAFLESLVTSEPSQVMLVPPDPDRRYVDKAQYKDVFLSSSQADGHGFGYVPQAELDASGGAASYYAWTPRPGLRMVGIDTLCEGGVTGPASNGNIDDPQFQWLRGELERATERDQLIVVFGHHPVRSLSCDVPDETPPPCTTEDEHGHDVNPGCDRDPRSSEPIHLGEDLVGLFHEFPHVITYVAGHTHENTVADFDRPQGGPGDFWGIETASLIDWPPQNRLIELMDNCDGTLSIFGTTLDTAAPATAPGSGAEGDQLTDIDLASISRTLAYNDPQAGAGSGDGQPRDRNVELLLDDPRRDPPPCKRQEPAEAQPDPSGTAPSGGEGSGGGTLPFTGLLVGGLLVAGAALFGGGALLRRLAARRTVG